ncbi:MAG TPA: hypothetical protein VEB63_07705 [Chitinophagaceae bacterium]|nr:hypothetical protein [Chitinophagaceae bacterium]
MKRIILFFATAAALACSDSKEKEKTAGISTESTTDKVPQAAEFADPKFVEKGKAMLAEFEKGNITEWLKSYADNAVYAWSAGDSLAGKAEIEKYWTERRGKVIQSVKFSNDIWLPIKINTPQRGPDAPGVWLLSWYQVDVTYKNGKRLTFWTHNDHHFNEQGLIDRTIQYIDRAPINEATK